MVRGVEPDGKGWTGMIILSSSVMMKRCICGAEHTSFMHWILLHSDGKPAGGYHMEKKLQTAVKQQKNCMSGI